jgi:hypothetical protein
VHILHSYARVGRRAAGSALLRFPLIQSFGVMGGGRGFSSSISSSATALPPPAGAPPASGSLSSQPIRNFLGYEFDFHSDHPYPIWLMDPEGDWYPRVYKVAQASGEVLTWWHELTGFPWWATIVVSWSVLWVGHFLNCNIPLPSLLLSPHLQSGICVLRAGMLPMSMYALVNGSRYVVAIASFATPPFATPSSPLTKHPVATSTKSSVASPTPP